MSTCMAVFGTEGLLFAGSRGENVKRWRLERGELLGTLEGRIEKITCLAACDTEGLLLTGSRDETVKCWHVESGELQTRSRTPRRSPVWPPAARRAYSSPAPATRP